MNKSKQFQEQAIKEKPHYSLRKLNVGVASVLLGATFYLLGPSSQTVKADTIPDDPEIATETGAEPKVADATAKEIADNTETASAETKTATTKPQLATFKTPKKKQTKTKVSGDNTNTTKIVPTNTENNQVADQVPDDVNTATSRNLTSEQTDKTDQDNTTDTENNITDANDIIANNESNQKNKLIGKSALSSLTKKTGKEDLKNTLINGTYDHDTDTIDFYGKNTQNNKDNNINLDQSNIGPLFNTQLPFIGSVKHIVFHNKLNLIGPADGLFSNCDNLIDITGLDNLNTSQVTDMSNMFYFCSSLTNLDLSNFDTSQVTNMNLMFNNCSSLTKLDLSNFNTSKVTDMNSMFYNCSKLSELDVSKFNTGKVTDMLYMFNNCSSLTKLDLSSFDTSKVTEMRGMFSGCSNLSELDVSNFDTSQVTDMDWMFEGCSSLTKLDLNSFNTSQVTTMRAMFYGCSSITQLDLSSFDTSQVTNMSWMFYNCSNLTDLNLSSFDTSKVINMNGMFQNDTKLQVLHLGNKFQFGDNVNLPDNTWYNVGSGTLAMPEGSKKWTSAELVKNYNPKTDADTYVVGSFIGSVKFHYLDQDNNNVPIKDAPAYTEIGYLDIANNKMYDNPAVTKALQDLKAKGYVLVKDTLVKDSDGSPLVTRPDEDFVFKHATQENVKANFTQDYVIHYVDANKQTVFDDKTSPRSKDTPLIVQGTYDFVTHQFLNDGKFKVIQGFDDTSYTLKNPIKKGYVADSSAADFSKVSNDYTNDALKQKTVDYFNDLLAKVPNHDQFDGTTGSVQGSFILPDLEQTVTYTKVGNYVIRDYSDSSIPNVAPIPYENDPNDASKVLGEQLAPEIPGYYSMEFDQTPQGNMLHIGTSATEDTIVHYYGIISVNFIDQNNDNQIIPEAKKYYANPHRYSPGQPLGTISKKDFGANSLDEFLNSCLDQGYELVSDPFANGPVDITGKKQELNYILKHGTKDVAENRTGKFNIYYTDYDTGKSVAPSATHNFKIQRTNQVDAVTGEITKPGVWEIDSDQDIPTIKSPVINGYVAWKGQVTKDDLIKNFKDNPNSDDLDQKPTDWSIAISYTKVGHFIPVDHDGNVIPNIEPTAYQNDPADATKVLADQAAPEVPGYWAVTPKLTPTDPTKDQTVAYEKDGATKEVVEKTTGTFKVSYVKRGDANAILAPDAPERQFNLHRTNVVDLKTGKIVTPGKWVIDDDQDIPTIDVPVVTGYIAMWSKITKDNLIKDFSGDSDHVHLYMLYDPIGKIIPVDKDGKVISNAPQPNLQNDPTDATKALAEQAVPTIAGMTPETTTITPKDPLADQKVTYLKNNKTIISFIDQDNNSKPISGIDPIETTADVGKPVTKPDKVEDILAQLAKQGYELVKDPFADSLVASEGQQDLQYLFKHKVKEVAQTTKWTQTVHFVDKDGNKLADDNVQTISGKQTGKQDQVTNKTTWNEWQFDQDVKAVKVPVVKGYLANQKTVAPSKIVPGKDAEINVTYQKLGGFVPVDANGKPIDGLATISYENDPDDPTKILSEQKVPKIPGYQAAQDTITPSDPFEDTKTIYKALNKTQINFIDQDNNNQAISGIEPIKEASVIGDKVEKPDGVDEIVKQLQDKGYELVTDPFKAGAIAINGTQAINYIFKHGTKKNTETVERKQTVHFVDKDGKTLAADNVQTAKFSRENTTDLVTNKVTHGQWTNISAIQDVKVPVITGYFADQALVKAQANPEQDTEITVIYQKLGGYLPIDQDGKPIGNGKVIYENDPTDATKIKHKLPDIPGFITPNWDDPSDLTQDTKVVYQAQNTQLQVVVHDDDTNKDLPDYAWSSGKVNVGDKVDYDWAKVKEQLTNAGYEIVKEPTIPDKYSDKAQIVTIHVKHSIIDFDPDNPPKDNGTTKWPAPDKYKQTHKRVIHLVDESGRTVGTDITQEVIFKRKLKVDAVTGAILNPDAAWVASSESYPEVKVPKIQGYTAKNKSKSGLDIKDDKLPSVKADMTDITDSIIYHKNGNSHWVDSDTNTPAANKPSQNSNGSNGSDNSNNNNLPDDPDNANSSVPTTDSDPTNSNKHKKKLNKTNKYRHSSSSKYNQKDNHGYNNSYLNRTNVGSVANENTNLSGNLPVANIDTNKLAKNAQSQLPQTGRDETDNLAIIGLAASLMGLTMISSIKRKKKE